MGVNITESNAAATSGSLVDTGQLFIVSPTGGTGPQDAPALCNQISDFTAAFGARTVGAITALWDYVDAAFRSGVNTIYALGYETVGGYADALALLDPRLGPGQITIVGEAAAEGVYEAGLAHAQGNNRFYYADVLSSDITVDALTAEGAIGQGLSNPDSMAIFGTWLNIPAPQGVVGGSARTVPASAILAGLTAINDDPARSTTGANPGAAVGGRGNPITYANSALFDPNASDADTIIASGVNPIRDVFQVLENYGFVTPIAKSDTTPFWQANAGRARMWLKANAAPIGEKYYMQTLDAAGVVAGNFGSDLADLCNLLWKRGGLYGATAGDAYNINVSITVNNDNTAATGTLSAVASVKFPLYADTVDIDLISVPILGVMPS